MPSQFYEMLITISMIAISFNFFFTVFENRTNIFILLLKYPTLTHYTYIYSGQHKQTKSLKYVFTIICKEFILLFSKE